VPVILSISFDTSLLLLLYYSRSSIPDLRGIEHHERAKLKTARADKKLWRQIN